MTVYELNMDGLVGPTHHYAGLSFGNIASSTHASEVSHPKAAAKQGIAKMRLLDSLGLKQGILPPHARPNLALLQHLGFSGSPTQQIAKASQSAPGILSLCYSAASMWSANCATVAPSSDTKDHKVHITAANLLTNLHRQQEADFSSRLLALLFKNERYFSHHPPLPGAGTMSDEGAANHNRLCHRHDQPGLHVFVYGKEAGRPGLPAPRIYPARQTKEASEAIARLHLLDPNNLFFACQNPKVIDAGVFHNDVIAVANESVWLVHEEAFVDQTALFASIQSRADFPLQIITITKKQLSVAEAVASYLFNSQLISLPDNQGMVLIAPSECQEYGAARACIEDLIADSSNPIVGVHYLSLKQSMHNGGGPACLRLRMPLQAKELAAMHQGVLATPDLLDQLDKWVDDYYPEVLRVTDLADPQLMYQSFEALDRVTQILQLGGIYDFQ